MREGFDLETEASAERRDPESGPGDVRRAYPTGSDARASRTVTEIRFFAPGRGPALADARHRRRRDRYYLTSLTRERSFKLRGTSGKGELKVLVGRDPVIQVADVLSGQPEQWAKFSVRLATTPDGWIELAKEIWRAGPVEVTSISSDLGPWWTLALQVGDGCPPLPPELSCHLAEHRPPARCHSYAAWLVESLGLDRPTS